MSSENKNTMLMMIKGKRTKRARPSSPLALTMSTSATEEGSDEANSTTSEEWVAANSTTSEEEADMAHCLILLAQGSNQTSVINNKPTITTTTANNNNAGVTCYECKTCNRSFPSFQALGGHRASHKKPKLNIEVPQPKKSVMFALLNNDHNHQHHQYDAFSEEGTTLSLQIASTCTIKSNNTRTGNKVNKVHECSICGAEFSSGQALGGHMRRHRPIGMSSTLPSPTGAVTVAVDGSLDGTNNRDEKTSRSFLSLDLNLPAPEDDHHLHRDSSKFVFPSNEKTLIFSASSLVDCHY